MRGRITWVALLVVAMLPVARASNGIKKPKDGGGIRWSSLRPCIVRFKLKNGQSVAQLRSVGFLGGYRAGLYEVDLVVDGKVVATIKVAVATEGPPAGFPEDGTWEDYTYHCHGFVFGESLYNPSGEDVAKILEAGWEEIECAAAKKGDIIVYYASGVDAEKPKDSITHSAVSNGDGTFASKNGSKALQDAISRADLDKEYGGDEGTAKCYRRKD